MHKTFCLLPHLFVHREDMSLSRCLLVDLITWQIARREEVRQETQTERTLGRREEIGDHQGNTEEAGDGYVMLKKGTTKWESIDKKYG